MKRLLCLVLIWVTVRASGEVLEGASVDLPVYTLEDCLRIGLERAGALRNSLRDREIAETTIGEIGAQVYPQLSARASYTRLDRLDEVTFGAESLELGALDNYSAGVSLRQLLYDGGSVQAALKAARDYRRLEAHNVNRVRAELIRDIRVGFTDVLLFEAVLEVHDQTVAQLREMVAQTERLFEQDQVSEFDLLNARVQLQNAFPDRVRARNALSVAQMAFRNLINLEETAFVLEGQLTQAPFDAGLEGLLEEARMRRPETLALERLAALRESDIRAEQGRFLPSVHATADYRGDNPAIALSTGDEGWVWRWQAGLQVSWDLLDGGLRRHSVQRKRLERDKALESLAEARRAVELDVRQALLRVRHAEEAAAVSRENVGLAARSLEIATTRYETGLITRLEFSEINLALMRARLNALQALRDHAQAINALKFATGEYAE